MSKLRILYIASFIVLGVLVILTTFRPIVSSGKYSTMTRESVIQGNDDCIIQFDIVNSEGKDTDYIINWSIGEEIYNSRKVSIKNGRTFTNLYHVYPETLEEDKLQLTIYKEGEAIPFEECTYYIRFGRL